MTKVDVFNYMKSEYLESKRRPDYDELVGRFPRLGIAEIMKGTAMFEDWMGDVAG